MSDNFEKRLSAAEKAYAAKYRTGALLTYPEGNPIVLHVSDVEGIAKAHAEGLRVFLCDDPLPPNGVIL
jgi:hypothetical protein